jgi:hypothetical protein
MNHPRITQCPSSDNPIGLPKRNFRDERFRNLFIPCFKLLRKERIGAKIRKIYGERKTPCERVLEHPDTTPDQARLLRELRDRYDPIDLSREVRRRKNAFFEAVGSRGRVPATTGSDELGGPILAAHAGHPPPLDSRSRLR